MSSRMNQISTALRSIPLLFFFSINLLHSTNSFPRATAQPQSQLPRNSVYDTYGQQLRAGNAYLMYSAATNRPIVFSLVGSEACPITVAEDTSGCIAYPLLFYPADSREGIIRLSIPVNIQFAYRTPCLNSTLWQAAQPDKGNRGLQLVKLEGAPGKPGCDTIRTWFKIENIPGHENKNIYSLTYDPNDVCDIPTQTNIVAPVYTAGVMALALIYSEPYPFVFQNFNWQQ